MLRRWRFRGIRAAIIAYAYDPRIMIMTEAGEGITDEDGNVLEI